MGPIETYFTTIALIVTLIGLARGYARELGSTVIILVTIFLLMFVQDRLSTILVQAGTRLALVVENEPTTRDVLLSTSYTLFFIAAVFAGYSGRTFSFGGRPIPPPQGTLLSLLVGLVNGYLVAGTLWYYQALYNYPLELFGRGIEPPFSNVALAMVDLLPQNLVPSASYWMLPIAILLLLRVRG